MKINQEGFLSEVHDQTKAPTQPINVQPRKIFNIVMGNLLRCFRFLATRVGKRYKNIASAIATIAINNIPAIEKKRISVFIFSPLSVKFNIY